MNGRPLRAIFAAVVCALLAASAAEGRMATDPKLSRTVARGLEWLANTQSRLGHWTANEGRYPTAM
ncbi:MAG TPA: hypothetical protein VIK18_22280, partial [Pirellulales bacterium]